MSTVSRGLSVVALLAIGAPLAWLFGANGPIAGLFAIVLLVIGVRLGRDRLALAASCYVALSLSQVTVVALVLSGALADRAVVPLLLPGHPSFHHALGHAAIQLVYFAAFASGLALARRYAAVVATIERAHRQTALRAALLEEARAEYRRAIHAGRDSHAPAPRRSEPPPVDLEDTEVQRPKSARPLTSPPAPRVETPSVPPPQPPSSEDVETELRGEEWNAAYRTRARGQDAMIFALAIVGALLLGLVGPGAVPTLVGCAGIFVVALLAMIARSNETLRAPIWASIGLLSVAPAYTVGLHSGFACVVTTLLFVGTAFEPASLRASFVGHYGVLAGTITSFATVFALLMLGVVPDAGNSAVLVPGRSAFEPYALHLFVQALFCAAFVLGRSVDARHVELLRQAERATKEAARREAQLRAADADVARALEAEEGTGLFTGQLVGPYRLGRVLASGGMGDVYEASSASDRTERAAVKLVRRERASESLTLALFEEEAVALSRVSSPFVAKVLGIGDRGSDLPYLAMELIEGSTLTAILRERGRLSFDEVRGLVRDVADGLRAVHAAGIIHRDVKPHNVMLTTGRGGTRWKIVDFGVAQLNELAGASSTVLAGTAPYMAPEHALGERVDARADLYALGLVAYRALVGRPAFTGDDRTRIAERAREVGPPSPHGEVMLPRELELVLRVALAARVEDRFATAAELRGAFESAFQGALSPRLEKHCAGYLATHPWATDG